MFSGTRAMLFFLPPLPLQLPENMPKVALKNQGVPKPGKQAGGVSISGWVLGVSGYREK